MLTQSQRWYGGTSLSEALVQFLYMAMGDLTDEVNELMKGGRILYSHIVIRHSRIFIIAKACGLEWTKEHQKQKSKTWLERAKGSRLQSPEIRRQENGFSPKSLSKKWNFSYALMLALWDSVQTSALRKRKRIYLWLKSLHLWQSTRKDKQEIDIGSGWLIGDAMCWAIHIHYMIRS